MKIHIRRGDRGVFRAYHGRECFVKVGVERKFRRKRALLSEGVDV